MSANIYFPAIPLLSQDFHTSISLMNLTVTVYLIFQGICEFPSFRHSKIIDNDTAPFTQPRCYGGRWPMRKGVDPST